MKTIQDVQQLIGYASDKPGRRIALVGHPGAGKTMIARRIRGALPDFERGTQEHVQVMAIRKAANLDEERVLDVNRPLRAPHHTCSTVALVGGGTPPRPGELSLAHGGVLFLDEVVEFRKETLQSVGHVLDQGYSEVHRSGLLKRFPAAPRCLVVALNPCPCGYFSSGKRRCRCKKDTILSYWRRASAVMGLLGIDCVEGLDLDADALTEISKLPT